MEIWHNQCSPSEDYYRLQDDEILALHSRVSSDATVPSSDGVQETSFQEQIQLQTPDRSQMRSLFPIAQSHPIQAWGGWEDFSDLSDQFVDLPPHHSLEQENQETRSDRRSSVVQTSGDILADIADDHRLNVVNKRRRYDWRRLSLSDDPPAPSSGEGWMDTISDPWLDESLPEQHTEDFSFIVSRTDTASAQVVPTSRWRRLDHHGTTVPVGFYTTTSSIVMRRPSLSKSKRQKKARSSVIATYC